MSPSPNTAEEAEEAAEAAARELTAGVMVLKGTSDDAPTWVHALPSGHSILTVPSE